jgi:hypothetical protein
MEKLFRRGASASRHRRGCKSGLSLVHRCLLSNDRLINITEIFNSGLAGFLAHGNQSDHDANFNF